MPGTCWDIERFEVGDVVFADGASAIEGDVIAIEPLDPDWPDEEQRVTVVWRVAETTESSEDLVLVARKGERL